MKKFNFLVPAVVMFFGVSNSSYSQNDDHEKHHPDEISETQQMNQENESNQMNSCSKGEDCPMKNNQGMMQSMGMKQGMMQGMMQGMGMMKNMGMMHSEKVELNVAEIDNGIIVKFSSKDANTINMLKNMGQKMKKMHPMMKGKMGNNMHQNMMGKNQGVMKNK